METDHEGFSIWKSRSHLRKCNGITDRKTWDFTSLTSTEELFRECSFERALLKDLRGAPRGLGAAPRRSFKRTSAELHGGPQRPPRKSTLEIPPRSSAELRGALRGSPKMTISIQLGKQYRKSRCVSCVGFPLGCCAFAGMYPEIAHGSRPQKFRLEGLSFRTRPGAKCAAARGAASPRGAPADGARRPSCDPIR
eukprot:gene14231-biopygen7006